MTLRVYLRGIDGKTDFIDYGLNADNYDGIIKTEIRSETSKVKTYSGSKWVGIPEIDNETNKKQVTTLLTKKPKPAKKKTPTYEIFNWKIHDTDRDYYWVSALCSNCNNSAQVAIPMKTKINKQAFKSVTCPKCVCEKTLHYARWDSFHKKYVRRDMK